jgi:hypothetical protein
MTSPGQTTPIRTVADEVIAADAVETSERPGKAVTVPFVPSIPTTPIAVEEERDRIPLLPILIGIGIIGLIGGGLVVGGFLGGQAPAPTPTPTSVAAATLTPTPSPSPTPRPTPSPTPSPTPTPTTPPVLPQGDQLAEHGLWLPISPFEDPPGDWFMSFTEQQPGNTPPYTDQLHVAAAVVEASEEMTTFLFNASTFGCGQRVDDILTACAGEPMPPGPMLVAIQRLAGPVPHEPSEDLVIYSLVVQGNSDPADDFEPLSAFPDDYYQGTDRWYELVWTAARGWIMTVDRGETSSVARATIWDDAVVFFVPLSEMSVEAPPFRLTAFASTDASFNSDTSGGDVHPGGQGGPWTLAEPVLGEDRVTAFVERFATAVRDGDEGFLFERLHPFVIQRYGADACRAYAATLVDPGFAVEVNEVDGPAAWDWVTDGQTTAVPNAYTLVADTTIEDQTTQGAELHFAPQSGLIRWFTDCGEPAG